MTNQITVLSIKTVPGNTLRSNWKDPMQVVRIKDYTNRVIKTVVATMDQNQEVGTTYDVTENKSKGYRFVNMYQ